MRMAGLVVEMLQIEKIQGIINPFTNPVTNTSQMTNGGV